MQSKFSLKDLVHIWLLSALAFSLFGNFTPQANATPSGNIYGEQITTTMNPLFVDTDSEERIFVTADDGKLYRSTDRGSSWSVAKDIGSQIKSLHVDSRDYVYLKYGGNMYRSTNHGDSWSTCSGWVDAGILWHWDEDSNGYIYVNNYVVDLCDYIYRSTDEGATWTVWYNVSATSNPVRHIHSVRVAPNDYVYVMTGDETTEVDDNTIRRWNGTAWGTLVESSYVGDREMRLTDMFFMNDYAWTCPDGSIFMYRFPYSGVSGNEWGEREKTVATNTFVDNELFDSLVIDGVGAFCMCDNGILTATWDGLHWVKVYEVADANFHFIRMSSRESFPIYWVDDENYKLYRLNQMTKEDLIQLFYKTYNAERGSVTNAETYVLEQRIHDGTDYVDLTSVALSDVQASIIGLSKKNRYSNPSFETGDTTGWSTSTGGGTFSVVSDEHYNGSYSFKAVKGASDTSYGMAYQSITIQRGDTLVVSFAVKSNDTMSAGTSTMNSPISLSIYNASKPQTIQSVCYGSTTSWRTLSYSTTFSSSASWTLGVRIHFGKLDLTSWIDSVLVRFPETSYQGDSGDENIAYNPELFKNATYLTGTINTTNPIITINSQAVSHSGELTNGTKSSETSLAGILTGAVEIDADIQGSGQAILKITGSRIVHVTNAVLQAHKDNVYCGRYYDTPTFSAGTNLVALISKQANITILSYAKGNLTLAIDAPSGVTSIAKIYCGDNGKPEEVIGATSWSYYELTKVLTVTASHLSSINIIIKWKLQGDANNDCMVNIIDLNLLSKAYGSSPTDSDWNENCDFNNDELIDFIDLAILGNNYGKSL